MRVLTVLVLALALAPAHPWACYHGDPQHSGRSTLGVGDSLGVAWDFRAGGDISGSPVVNSSGQVLFAARDARLYCLNHDGSQAWATDLAEHGTAVYFSTPALDDAGNAYITTNRRLVKVSPTGSVLWHYPDHRLWSVSHSPVIGADGKTYFASYADSLCALRPDGTLDWARDLGLDVNSAPAVGLDGRIYVATTRGTGGWKLWAFEPDGSEAWSFDLAAGADFASPAVGPDSTVYVGAGRYLYAVSAAGSLKWRDSLPASVSSCPAVANDSTLYVTAGAYLYRVSSDSGVRWRKYLGGSNYSAPAVDANGFVFVGSAYTTAPALLVIAPDSTVLWSQPMPDEVWASPAIGPGGRVYAGCMDGAFFALQGSGLALGESGPGAARPVLRAWPSPTSGRLRLSGPAGIDQVPVGVFDAAGRSVGFRRAGELIDLAGLPAGVYVVSVRAGGGVLRCRVVLE
ncbi:MAG: PQQ-binding-like beta-propeller repeat protein [bacterium]